MAIQISKEDLILHSRNWVQNVVIGLGFCPFASKPFYENKIRYHAIVQDPLHLHPKKILEEINFLNQNQEIETTLVIFAPQFYQHFSSYLQLIKKSETLLHRHGFKGQFQLASFHQQYQFESETTDAASLYTNRSPYPMVHIIREDSIVKARKFYPNIHEIPERNKKLCMEKGVETMKMLLMQCMQ